jgi:membrane associated rhomboid family serine protease
MAFRSNGPVTLTLPPFRGATRRIILTAIVGYLVLLAVRILLSGFQETLLNITVLAPDLMLHGEVWTLLTYPFVGLDLLGVAFASLSVWFFGSVIEEERGSRWLIEFFLVTTVGGGLLASLLTVALAGRPGWIPFSGATGLWPFVLAVMIAFAYFNPDQTIRIYFVLPVKAKYLAAFYVLIYLVSTLTSGDRFTAAVALMNGLCGYLFLRLAPRRGARSGASEWWYGLRNAYYRAKRRRAAKKFTVYMRKQGKEVSLDDDGRYVDPNGRPHDPNDKRWMN